MPNVHFVLGIPDGHIEHNDIAPIDAKTIVGAWRVLDSFLMGRIDDLGLELDDEQYREIFIELLLCLAYREASVLRLLPFWEENFKENVGTRKRGPNVKRPMWDL